MLYSMCACICIYVCMCVRVCAALGFGKLEKKGMSTSAVILMREWYTRHWYLHSVEKKVGCACSVCKREKIIFITHLKPLQPKTAMTDDLWCMR
jgi:hypothetical protein